MNPSPEKWSCAQNNFFPYFLQECWFFENIVKLKNIQYLIFHKKGYIHFRRRTLPSLQKRLGPQKQFFVVFSENTAFFEKTAK